MKHLNHRRHRGVTALSAAVLALGSVGFLAGPALAAPGDGGTGSITVTKLEQTNGPIGTNDGTKLPDLGGAKPLVAGFTSCAIDGIDLDVSAHWDRLKGLAITPNPAGGVPIVSEGATQLTLSNCAAELQTNATTGEAVFTALAADRAYVVFESTPAVNAVSAAQPVLVTVPYPGVGTGTEINWNYSPHIYPKNVVAGSGATKDGKIIGDKVSFDVTVPVNPLAEVEKYEEFRITDHLSTSITYTAGSVKLFSRDGSEVALDPADLTLTAPAGTAGQVVEMAFTATGLAKLDANIGGKVVLTIAADASASGSTANEANITINGKATENGQGPSVVNPETFFSGAHIVKKAQRAGAADPAPLAGAEFSVYPTDAAATDCPAAPAEGSTPVFEKQESDQNGNTPNMVLAEGTYCVYETKVPAGFKGLQNGMLFQVAGENASVEILNTQIGANPGDLPALPITGSTGQIALFIAGGALLAVAIGAALLHRRKATPTAE